MSYTLLPCPFCGQAPTVQGAGPAWTVGCRQRDNPNCPTNPMTLIHDTELEAVHTWNRRPNSKPQPAPATMSLFGGED